MRKFFTGKVFLSNLGLALVLVVGLAYLLIGISNINPFRSTYTVTVNMCPPAEAGATPERLAEVRSLCTSGGLQPRSEVTFRGVRVGKITAVDITETGLAATAELDNEFKIPRGGAVAVQALSAAGEQYIDFRPDSDEAPYLADGDVIDAANVKTPVPITKVLDNATAFIEELDLKQDPDRIATVVSELEKAIGGGTKPGESLRALVSGLNIATAGLDSLLPQTRSLVAQLQTILGTTALAQPDLGILTQGTGVLFDQLVRADAEVRKLLDSGPGFSQTLGGVVRQETDPLTSLVTNFVAISKAASVRTPALAALFPSLEYGLGRAGTAIWDGKFHAVLSLLPIPACNYDVQITNPGTVTPDGSFPLWTYCDTNDPTMQIRGAANAPRPPGSENTSIPPQGVDLNQRSAPYPKLPPR